MRQLKTLAEVLKTHPDFKPKWQPTEDLGMQQEGYGKVERKVVCNEDGKPLYDQWTVTETPGAVIIPYDFKNGVVRVGLIEQERHCSQKFYLEAPRGIGEKDESTLENAVRELSEETTQLADKNAMKIIGKINQDTAHFTTSPYVVMAQFKELGLSDFGDVSKKLERIKSTKPYSFRELCELRHNGSLECGMTNCALFMFGMEVPEFYRG